MRLLAQANSRPKMQPLLLLLFLAVIINALTSSVHAHGNALSVHHGRYLQQETDLTSESVVIPLKPFGDESCPCLTPDQLLAYNRPLTPSVATNLGPEYEPSDLDTFGLNCQAHDLPTAACSNVGDCITKIPLPNDCDKSYCRRSWCYVDADNCNLENAESLWWPGGQQSLHFSYATCGFLDGFSSTDRLNSLRNRTLRVAFNSNTGGWKGAYNEAGHFARNGQWDGPLVHFMRDAALRGGFELELQSPPDWIRNSSQAFFGGSPFDLCIYATSLGFLDLCVAAFTVTTKRASVATFFELTSDPVYLVTFAGEDQATGHEKFRQQLATIFRPFTWSSWALIVLFVLPLLGLLMLFHEHGVPGSAFPKERDLHVVNHKTGETKIVTQNVPTWSLIGKSLYMSILSFTSETFDMGVITQGGKIHLLGIYSFLVLVLAVYTANLAAILTTSASKNAVESLEEALQAGYTFCVNRKLAGTLSTLYNIDPQRFVVDPISEGGDGLPGFNCGRCQARARTVDFMKLDNTDPSLYCDAAIMAQQDLQVYHQYGQHCNKTTVGDILTFVTFGMPITNQLSPEMSSWLYKMKYEGLLTEHLRDAEPMSQCAAVEEQSEGIGLTIQQLTGIWVIVFTFVLGGLITKAFWYYVSKKEKAIETQKILIYDQWGRAMENMDLQRPAAGSVVDARYSTALQAAKQRVPNYVTGDRSRFGNANNARQRLSSGSGHLSITSRQEDQANDARITIDMFDGASKRPSAEKPAPMRPEQGLAPATVPEQHSLAMEEDEIVLPMEEDEIVVGGFQDGTVVSM